MRDIRVRRSLGTVAGVCLSLLLPMRAFSQQKTPPSTSDSKVDWGLFLPAGEGKFQTAVYCSSCHTLQQIVAGPRTDEAGWLNTVQTMAFNQGANIQDDDIAIISKYLARFFGPSTPKLELPIHINTAPKEMLILMGTLSDADVQKILGARSNGGVKDAAALEALVGRDKIVKYQSLISFDDGPQKSK